MATPKVTFQLAFFFAFFFPHRQGKDHKKSIQKINLSKKSAKCTSCGYCKSRQTHFFLSPKTQSSSRHLQRKVRQCGIPKLNLGGNVETVQGKDHKKSIQKINLSKKSAKCTSCESASRVKHIFSCHQKHNLLPATCKEKCVNAVFQN